MAIYHLTMKLIARASGRSAVAAAAYRSGEVLTNARDGMTHDFTHRRDVEHAEIVIPAGSDAQWALDRSELWNAAELAERRKDSRVAREIELSLPHELSAAQRVVLAREFAQAFADRYGAAVDIGIHAPHDHSDDRNYHVHLLMTTRQVSSAGLGDKTALEWENKKLLAEGRLSTHDQLRGLRADWSRLANEHLARAGVDARIDHRSLVDRGLSIEPTEHIGIAATEIKRQGRGTEVSRGAIDADSAKRNAELIREKPEEVLAIISGEKSVFDRHDVARALHRYIDTAEGFQSAYAKVMGSPALVELAPERQINGRLTLARYSTVELVTIERDMAAAAERMHADRAAGVPHRLFDPVLAARPYLAEEQRLAVSHVTGPERIAAVVGLAGAGKSTLLGAAREAWEQGGYTVVGAALSGKAAAGLEESSGIASKTLHSLERGWARGFDLLQAGDVLVVDEAGMVSSRQMARVIGIADRAGAKVVLVGDPEQLQPIQAGAAFRAITERVGFVELGEIRRQTDDWQRKASVDFGRYRTGEGLAAYDAKGAIRLEADVSQAREAIVRDAVADMDANSNGSRLVLAHRRADVKALNEQIRIALQAKGALSGEVAYQTNDGERRFAAGDRILFLENHRELGVKNGTLATVEKVEDGKLSARLDSAKGAGRGKSVSVSMADYAAVDHGYATTIHKSQGATVDRAFVLASPLMDRHLTYVAMTRHRASVRLYGGRAEFADTKALAERLGRANAKETTLDYAQRRGVEAGAAAPAREPALTPELRQAAAAGMADFRAQFELQRQIEQGKQKARDDFERAKAGQARLPQKSTDKQANIERQIQERSRDRGDPDLSR